MKHRARIADVASLAGVSVATVSRTLSNPDSVKPATRERVQRAIDELNYFMDGSARALASGHGHTVGMVVPTLDNSIFALAVQGLQTTLAAHGYQLLIAAHEYNLETEARQVRALLEKRIDALVLVGTDHSDATWDLVRRSGTPLLVAWATHESYPSVAFDNRLIGQLAAEHLLALGHTQFGMISGYTRYNDRARQRADGFIETLQRNNIAFDKRNLIEQPFGFPGGRTGWTRLMQLPVPPTAIFCGNDVLAMGCMFEAQKHGIQLPRDLSIVGCDNLPIVSHLPPGLTTVQLPTYELGIECAHSVLEWIEKDARPASVCLDIELIVRGTTGKPPATPDTLSANKSNPA